MCGVSGTLTFSGAPFLAPNLTDALCADGVTRATAFNNWRCAIAAFFMILGVNLLLSYIPVLIFNLHLSAVWRSNRLYHFEKVIHSIIWTSSIALTVAPFVLGIVGATPSVPMIMDDHLTKWILYPRAPLIFGSFLLHIYTGVYLLRTSRQANAQLKSVAYVRLQIDLQWRSMVLAFVTCGTFVMFISYYLAIGAAFLGQIGPSTPWVKEWLLCIVENVPNGQNKCTDIAQRNLPDEKLTQLAVSSFLLCGVWAVVTVGSSTTLLQEFWDSCVMRYSRYSRHRQSMWSSTATMSTSMIKSRSDFPSLRRRLSTSKPPLDAGTVSNISDATTIISNVDWDPASTMDPSQNITTPLSVKKVHEPLPSLTLSSVTNSGCVNGPVQPSIHTNNDRRSAYVAFMETNSIQSEKASILGQSQLQTPISPPPAYRAFNSAAVSPSSLQIRTSSLAKSPPLLSLMPSTPRVDPLSSRDDKAAALASASANRPSSGSEESALSLPVEIPTGPLGVDSILESTDTAQSQQKTRQQLRLFTNPRDLESKSSRPRSPSQQSLGSPYPLRKTSLLRSPQSPQPISRPGSRSPRSSPRSALLRSPQLSARDSLVVAMERKGTE
ncbi:hypothetical protein HK102_005782 [Quaeritorhiza haematococci]|nr:hypothetical protein HK102_005782 [Quaeritorhiza haematococci]